MVAAAVDARGTKGRGATSVPQRTPAKPCAVQWRIYELTWRSSVLEAPCELRGLAQPAARSAV
jgi:hypothetical protein